MSFTVGSDAEDAGVSLIEEWNDDLINGTWSEVAPVGLARTRDGDEVMWELNGTWINMYYRSRILLP